MRCPAAVGLAVTLTVLCGSAVVLASPASAAPVAVTAPVTGTSAAEKFGWGAPDRADEFSAPLGSAWGVYNGPGHNGAGRRTPAAVSVADGVLTLSGDAAGNTAGMAWGPGRKYGRWEGRVRAPAGDPSYHPVMLLWPDAENWPVGGEVDFMEMMEGSRQTTNMFLHYGASNSQIGSQVTIDGTQWHDWAVEWAPGHIAAFVDGVQWFRTTNTSILPPGPMHLCIQLDWFPQGRTVRPSSMQVDWVRQYPYRAQPVTSPVPTTTPAPTTPPAPRTTPPTTPPTTPSTTPTTPPRSVPTTTAPVRPVPPRTTTPAPRPPAFDPAADFQSRLRAAIDRYRVQLMAALSRRG